MRNTPGTPEPSRNADSAGDAFERRIAALHQADSVTSSQDASESFRLETHHAEMLAMVDSFLGPDYDRPKVIRLLELQDLLHERQSRLLSGYQHRRIPAEDYVGRFNQAMRADLEACEKLLGVEDFSRLFGGGIDEAEGYIDLDTFLASEAGRVGGPLQS